MNLANLSDEELMTMYQNGAEEPFKVLYARHSAKIYSFLKKRVTPIERVADIYQETFLKIHKSKHLYNKTLPVLPWIFTIANSVFLDAIKKEKNFKNIQVLDLDQFAAATQSVSSVGLTMPAIQKLDGNQKIAVHMRHVEEKTFEEIAQSLKTSPANARQIMSRGIKRLKELINDDSKGGQS